MINFIPRPHASSAFLAYITLPSGFLDEKEWERVMFIVAFDTSFEYSPEEETGGEEDEEDCAGPESDYLDDETTFRYDVIKECDRIALAGAALAKQIGSDTYGLWRAAMIKLGDRSEEIQHKAVDDIVTAGGNLQESRSILKVLIGNASFASSGCGYDSGR